MKNVKKVLCFALTLALVLSAVSFFAFAEEAPKTAVISIAASKTEPLENGETVTITVSAKADEDFYVGPVSVPVTYDADLFNVSNVKANDIFGKGTTEAVSNTDVAGQVTVVITPDVSTDAVYAPNLKNGELVLYTFDLTAKVDSGNCDVTVVNDPKTKDHTIGVLYMGSFYGEDPTNPREAKLSLYNTLNVDDATVNLQIGEDNDPILKGIDTGYVDVDRMYVYGVPVGTTDLTPYFEVENGYFEVSGEGTGATLTVYKTSGEEYETYTLIIFGDVNGDNFITIIDASTIKSAASGVVIEDEAQSFAADVNGDSFITIIDASTVKSAASGIAITVNPYAD